MISIQELGLSILSDNPSKLYVIGGTEYGVKDKYIERLKSFYGKFSEYPDMESVISMLGKRHIIPLDPQLYIVRYDESFVSSISEVVASRIRNLKFQGTIVCLYSQDKHIEKINKFLPEFTSSVSNVNEQFIEKYLHSDFPKLDDRSIKIATQAGANYGHSRNICRSMMAADLSELNRMTDAQLYNLFGCRTYSNEKDFQVRIAARDFRGLVGLLSEYNGDKDSLIYTILQTMLEMEKILSSKYSNSDLKDYGKYWNVQDVYYMFMNTYDELKKLRSNTSSDVESSLIYLFSLVTFQPVPAPEVLSGL